MIGRFVQTFSRIGFLLIGLTKQFRRRVQTLPSRRFCFVGVDDRFAAGERGNQSLNLESRLFGLRQVGC